MKILENCSRKHSLRGWYFLDILNIENKVRTSEIIQTKPKEYTQ